MRLELAFCRFQPAWPVKQHSHYLLPQKTLGRPVRKQLFSPTRNNLLRIAVDSTARRGRLRRCSRCGRSGRCVAAGQRRLAGCGATGAAAGRPTGRAAARLSASPGAAAGCCFGRALDGARLYRCDWRRGRHRHRRRHGLHGRWGSRRPPGSCRDITGTVGGHRGSNGRVGSQLTLGLQGGLGSGTARRFGCLGRGGICFLGGGSGRRCGGNWWLSDAGAGGRSRAIAGRDPGCRCSADLGTGCADCGFRRADGCVSRRHGARRCAWRCGRRRIGRCAGWGNGSITA